MKSNASVRRWWYDERIRGVIFQIIAISAVGFVIYSAVANALNNLEARGITTGFGFLGEQAGFSIIQTLIDYDETYTFGRTFVVGLLNTLLVSAMGIVIATFLGFFIGIGRLSNNWLLSKFCATYIEIFRNLPLLANLFLVLCSTAYFASTAPKPKYWRVCFY